MTRLAMIPGIALAALAASPAAAADCELSLQNASSVLTPYDPFAAADTVVDLQLRVTNQGTDACEARLYLDPATGSRTLFGGSDVLDYRFDGSPAGSGTGPYRVDLAAGASTIVPVRVIVPKQQVVPRSDYVGDLLARVEPVAGGTATLAGAGFSMSIQVPARVEMSISGAPSTNLSTASMAPASIDLSTMSEGQIGRAFVNIWANGPVSVSLTSQNGGRMLLDGHPTAPAVLYTATFDGTSVAFPTSVSRNPPLSIVGGAYELAVRVGSLQGRYAGRYSDVVTVDVQQN